MRNALSVDLEDYYHVTAFAVHVDADGWDRQESRIERNTDHLLELLASVNCRATFFTLGWVGERHPQTIRKIVAAGHEIGCHSHRHRLIYEMSRQDFREDTIRAKGVLENAGGTAVRGYRAPSFSITRDSVWALEILVQLGFDYDSSVFPVRHPNYGMPGVRPFPVRLQTPSGFIVEFPMSTLALGKRSAPVGGGAYLRFLPYWYTRWSITFLNKRQNQPLCLYMHPWEIDPDQPRMKGGLTSRIRHYFGLRGTEAKLRRLFADFEFVPLGDLVAQATPGLLTLPLFSWAGVESS